jgi:alpha-tubulin suppressor-like RCC1 family protein
MASSSSSSSTSSSQQQQQQQQQRRRHVLPQWCPEKQIYIDGIVPGATQDDINEMIDRNNGVLYVFGYGSLCWKAGDGTALAHPKTTSFLGHLPRYQRIWGQKSTDHRGVPAFPGVVCTLLSSEELNAIRGIDDTNGDSNNDRDPSSTSSVEGMVYAVPPTFTDRCLQELDFREKGGYAREIVTIVKDSTGEPVQALLYRGIPTNPAFSNRLVQDLLYAACTISVSVGPSGPNHEYLHQLYDFLVDAATKKKLRTTPTEEISHDDTYILDDTVRTIRNNRNDLKLYFMCGTGSNQHGQLIYYKNEDEDFSSMTESLVVCSTEDDACTGVVDRPITLLCGGGHSGLLTESGKLYLWGWNAHGQCSHNIMRKDQDPTGLFQNAPILQPLHNIVVGKASLGFSHTLVIEKGTHHVYAFGDNEHGQCTATSSTDNDDDDNSNQQMATPKIPSILHDLTTIDVAAGLFHSAAITTDGELITWGHSRYGQVATDETYRRWKPSASSDDDGGGDDDIKFVSVVCGRHHTAVLDNKGRVWTQGENKFGQLGRETSPDTGGTKKKNCDPIPRLVDGPLGRDHDSKWRCVELQSGWSHLVARVEIEDANYDSTRRIEVYGWGRSDKGQLGVVEKVVPAPRRIDLDGNVSAVACGSDSTHFMVDDGNNRQQKIFSVGWNEHGNLGSGSKDDRHEIQEMPGVIKIVSPATYSKDEKILFAAGGAHFLAMKI